jgi:plastocyanin
MSLQVTNVGSATLQGMSRGERRARYGFEYTIPVTLRRYAHHAAPPPTSDTVHFTPSSTATGQVVQLHIQSLAFRVPAPIAAGTTVEWINDDPVAHSVVAADGQFRSPLIPPGKTWRYTFTQAGSFAFACSPHPFMRGVITVQ